MVFNNCFLLYTTQHNGMSKIQKNLVELFCVVCCTLQTWDNKP
jgi:hypothetical protein